MCNSEARTRRFLPPAIHAVAGWFLVALILAGSGAAGSQLATNAQPAGMESLERNWGIQVTALRLSAQGYMVDFRYKVLDPGKAAALADPNAKPCLVDQATGARLNVPRSPKVGPLRQSAQNLTGGKIYFALFANPGKVVKSGSKVTVAIGDFKAEDLVVE